MNRVIFTTLDEVREDLLYTHIVVFYEHKGN